MKTEDSTQQAIITMILKDCQCVTQMIYAFLHALGLPHTFNANEDQEAKYTYEVGKTDNILDYGSMDKYSLFEWQWYVINQKLKL